MAHLRSTKPPAYRATLAYLIPYPDTELYVDYFKLHSKGAKARAQELGYSLETIWLKDLDYDMGRLDKFLKARGIPGLILNGESLAPDAFAGFDWSNFAVASWGFSFDQPMLHRTGYHYMQGMRLLLSKLEKLGYRRIAMVISEDHDQNSDHTILPVFNYEERHRSRGKWMKSYPLKSWHSNRGERRKIQAWLRENRPEVVIGETITWEAIEEMKWKVPADIAFVSPNWSAVWPDIGGVDHLPEVIGANSVELVADQLTRNERGVPKHPKLILNEGQWRDGASVPPNSERQLPGQRQATGASLQTRSPSTLPEQRQRTKQTSG
jgi:LacI family transcriptional regulator